MTIRSIQIQLPLSAQHMADGSLTAGYAAPVLAWTLSLGLHILILAPMIFIRPLTSIPNTAGASVTPTAAVAPARNSMRESTTVPKPRVVGPAAPSTELDIPQMPSQLSRSPAENEGLIPIARSPQNDSGKTPVSHPRYTAPQVEFFGSRLDSRKVCFVVDASGSMLGLFSTVRSHLIRSVQGLQPDQYFSVIFFNDKLLESSPGSLVRATASAKSSAISFISAIQPAGPTDPVAALRKAMLARDTSGDAPTIIYFLTDGFDLAPRDADSLPAQIRALRKQLAPAVKINTIGFWTQPHDCAVLQKIAEQSGGQFVSVTD